MTLDLGALHQTLAEHHGLDDFLQDVVEHAVDAVDGADSCSVTLRRDREPITAASSDGRARRLDELQYEIAEGPCVCSMEAGVDHHAPDLARETRWDGYPARARAEGIRSVIATPLAVHGRSLGALNLYAREPGAFERESEEVRKLAAQAGGAVAVALRIERALETANDLRAAMLSRSVIDQAIGIVMAQRRCDADTAMAALRRASQRENVKLRDLSARLVAVTGGQPPRPGIFTVRGDHRPGEPAGR